MKTRRYFNIVVSLIIFVGFLLTFMFSYYTNYNTHWKSIENISSLTSEGIYNNLRIICSEPIYTSLAMANDNFLKEHLIEEPETIEDLSYVDSISTYLDSYRKESGYDSVFLISTESSRYYNFNGLDRVLSLDYPEDSWYFSFINSDSNYNVAIDNDQVAGADDQITFFVNCRILGNNGETLGVVGVGVKIDNLQTMFMHYNNDHDVNAYLTDETGVIQISPEYTSFDKVNMFDIYDYEDEVKEKVLSCGGVKNSYSVWTKEKTNRYIKSYVLSKYLPELSMYLIVENNTAELMEQTHSQLIKTALTYGIIVLLVLTISTNIANAFDREKRRLVESIETERKELFRKATEQLFENIYELDITNDCASNKDTETYFESVGAGANSSINNFLNTVAKRQIKEEFRQGYIDIFSRENVLKAYESGIESLRYDCMISTGGDYYWIRISSRIVTFVSDGSIHLLTYRQNIDAEKQREKRMVELSQKDEMTGIYTKTATERIIGRKLLENNDGEYGLFVLDIDNFKQANDNFGHAFGDEVIKTFVNVLKSNFRKSDIVGRVGGDEFAVFADVKIECLIEKAEKLSQALNFTYTADGKSWDVSASIGISVSPKDGTDFEELYKKADIALYDTKKSGKNHYTIYNYN